MKAISTEKAPAAIGPYSQAIEANGFVFASGQLPIDPTTGNFPEGGIKEQTRQSLTNAKSILEAAGTDLGHVVKTTVFLSDMGNFAAMNEVYAEFFSAPYPGRSAVAVKDLHNGSLDIESGVGVGTTVTLTFPIYNENKNPDIPQTEVVRI